jgi:hypothetical protein
LVMTTSAFASCALEKRPVVTPMQRQPAAWALETSSGVSPTATVRSLGQLPARSRATSKSSARFSRSQPKAPAPPREELGQPETFHPRVCHVRWIAGQKRTVLDRRGRLRSVRAELPVARVGVCQQTDVLGGERLAPPRKTGVDRGFRNAGRPQRTPNVRRRCIPRDIGPVHVHSKHCFQRKSVRLDIDLVVAQQQRPVDVEQDEPGQTATTASTASRNVRTYSRNAAGPSSATSTAREPTTIPSASSAATRAWSGVEIPKPA